MQFLDPTSPTADKKLRRPVSELRGARVALLNNGWASMTRIGHHLEGPLKSVYGVATVVHYDVPRNREPAEGVLDGVTRDCDVAIVGLAN